MDIKKISEVFSIIKKARYQVYLVGGSSRDYLYGRDFLDVDITTNAPLEFIKKNFQVYDEAGAKYGSIKIIYKNIVMEITIFRKEIYEEKSYYPKKVEFVDCPEIDATRRDFTIDAIYLDLLSNEIIDPLCGVKDLFSFTLKFIGDPQQRINEDPTRILRGLRIANKMNFSIEEKTNQAFIDNIDKLDLLTDKKFNLEIEKMYLDLKENKTKQILEKYKITERKKANENK